ncbi:hypothetical protein HY085_00325, partial [Candidatus Gottesmanbacteria bacterium]|nr:hypothetical protein [Candidatus Gottesmanbacteria bacterium]
VEKAAELVNSNGGAWGYVTIPIRANERNLEKWTKFMEDSQKLHIIPILRIASFPVDDRWMAPNEYDLADFANFLDQLPWPTQNRYIVVYNETNRDSEWGGFVNPSEYARVLDRAIDIFHKRNPDFFIISAGLDPSVGNEDNYLWQMNVAWPGIFSKIDGFAIHVYANFGFEENYLCKNFFVCNLKVFITEADKFFPVKENVVAITPFVLNAQAGPFVRFSFLNSKSEWKSSAQEIINLPKIAGQPQLAEKSVKMEPAWNGNSPRTSNLDLKTSLSQIFFRILTLVKLWP